MKNWKALLIVTIGLSLWLGGCKVKHPGSPLGDVPPSTTLSVAPRDSSVVNYYVTLQWAGNDPDGTVTGFNVTVDDTATRFTASQDTTIAFFSPDTNRALHSFKVQAVDNAGNVDPNPPIRHFYTINQLPSTGFGSVGIVNGDQVGRDFRVSVTSASPRPSSTFYSISLDNQSSWTAWTPDSIFAFAAPELLSDPLFPVGVFGVSNAGLTPGQHTIFIRSENAGGAVSAIDSAVVTVGSGAGFEPVMDTTVTATYGGNALYPDGSTYFVQATGQTVSLAVSATAPHKGEINAYRFRNGQVVSGGVNWANWGNWQSKASLDTTDLPAGDYAFQFQARDLANDTTPALTYMVHLVQQALSDSVIIAADTRSGSGAQGLPTQDQVNQFYERVLTAGGATKYRVVQATVDPNNPDSTRHGKNYLSPYDVRNAGLVLWHMDDANLPELAQQTNRQRILGDYLGKGGRIIMSGWNLIAKFQDVTGDSIVFDASSYAVTRLKIFSGWRQGSQTRVLGFDGTNGFSSVRLDSSKIRSSFGGRLNNCWTFDPQGQDIVIGLMSLQDSTSNPRHHRPTAYLYNLSYRIAVFGVPLYFGLESDVTTLFDNPADPNHAVLTIMMQGLHPAI